MCQCWKYRVAIQSRVLSCESSRLAKGLFFHSSPPGLRTTGPLRYCYESITRACPSSTCKHRPSWVPDWNDSSSLGGGLTSDSQVLRRALSSEANQNNQDAPDASKMHIGEFEERFHGVQRFYASSESTLCPVRKDECNVLHLQGLFCDEIVEASNVLTKLQCGVEVVDPRGRWRPTMMEHDYQEISDGWSQPFATLNELQNWVRRDLASNASAYPTGGSRREAFLRTVCSDSVPLNSSLHNVVELEDCFDGFFATWEQKKKWYKSGRRVAKGWSEDTKEINAIGAQLNFSASHFNNAASVDLFEALAPIYNRRLASTKQGLIGLVPAAATVGDRVVIIQGGHLPLIMRAQNDGTYQLIGESYIHGIMHGEAWDESFCEEIAIS